MAQTRSSTHFAFALVGRDNAFSAPFRQQTAQLPRGMNMSSMTGPSPTSSIPTLGNTGVKFNSSRWTNVGEEMGLSVFDTKGAMDCIQNAGVTLYGYKLFPDLTPGRAFMWGSILAAWTVGSVALASARALDIYSVDDVKVKLQAAFAPLKDTLRRNAGDARSSIELREQPAAIQQMHTFGGTLRRSLS